MFLRKCKTVLAVFLCLALLPFSVAAAGSQSFSLQSGPDLFFNFNHATGELTIQGENLVYDVPHNVTVLNPDIAGFAGIRHMASPPVSNYSFTTTTQPLRTTPGSEYTILVSAVQQTPGTWTNDSWTFIVPEPVNPTLSASYSNGVVTVVGNSMYNAPHNISIVRLDATGNVIPGLAGIVTMFEVTANNNTFTMPSPTIVLVPGDTYRVLVSVVQNPPGTWASGYVDFTVPGLSTPGPSNLTLTNITTSTGTLNFVAGTLNYTVNVPHNVSSITLTPVLAPYAVLTNTTGPATLAHGNNVFTFVVTAEDGTVRTYTVTVNRAAAPAQLPPVGGTGGGGGTAAATPTPAPTATPQQETPETDPTPATDDPNFVRFTAFDSDSLDALELPKLDIDLSDAFVDSVLDRDALNAMFLFEEVHEFGDDVPALIRVYVGDLNLSDEQLIMLVGFEYNPESGEYTVIRGFFDANRTYFFFEIEGEGIVGAMFYERPMPLLRFTIGQVRYYHNGQPLTSDAAPFISANRTMVPIRIISEALGATPRWDDATRTAYIYGDTVLRLPMGVALPDGMGTPEMRNNRVLVPARFVIENFDAITLWNAALQEVTVYVW